MFIYILNDGLCDNLIISRGYRITMKTTQQTDNSTQGNFLNDAMQEIEESIKKIFDGEKLKW